MVKSILYVGLMFSIGFLAVLKDYKPDPKCSKCHVELSQCPVTNNEILIFEGEDDWVELNGPATYKALERMGLSVICEKCKMNH